MEKIELIDLQKRKLQKCYLELIFITENIKTRNEGCFCNRKLYILLGTDICGNRQIIGTYFENTEYNRFWLEVFEDMKARGLEFVLFLVTPHHKNIERCFKIIYNGANIIYSPEELLIDITRFFTEKSSRKFVRNLKDLFFAQTLENHIVEMKMFEEQFANNKIVLKLLNKREPEIQKFYEHTYEIRKFLYPYYAIRDMKRFLRKLNTKDPLCSNIEEINVYFLEYINSFESSRSYYRAKWLELLNILYERYEKELEEYINV